MDFPGKQYWVSFPLKNRVSGFSSSRREPLWQIYSPLEKLIKLQLKWSIFRHQITSSCLAFYMPAALFKKVLLFPAQKKNLTVILEMTFCSEKLVINVKTLLVKLLLKFTQLSRKDYRYTKCLKHNLASSFCLSRSLLFCLNYVFSNFF